MESDRDLAPTVTPVEVERMRLEEASSPAAGGLDSRNAIGVVAGGALGVVLAVAAVWAVSPLGPLALPVLVATIGGIAIGAAIVARRPKRARAEFARLRQEARRERPVHLRAVTTRPVEPRPR